MDGGGGVERVEADDALGSEQVVETVVIEGFDENINYADGYRMTVFTSPYTLSGVFIIGDPVWGVIGGPGRIGF